MAHTAKLKGRERELAEKLGICYEVFCAKMHGFTIGEAQKIVEILELTCDEATSMFFPNEVSRR